MMEAIATGISVLIGIVIGTVAQIGTRMWERREQRREKIKSLIGEMRFNIIKLEGWLQEIEKCKEATLRDELHTWLGYFSLHEAVFQVSSTMLASGEIYGVLGINEVKALQLAAGDLSPNGTGYVNGELEKIRNKAIQFKGSGKWLEEKQDAMRFIEWWEGKLRYDLATFCKAVQILTNEGDKGRATEQAAANEQKVLKVPIGR